MQTNFAPEQLARSGDGLVGDDPAHLRPLRILHRDLPDLPAPGRRARFAARAHLPDQGDARARQAGNAGDRQAYRPLPLVPCLHDDLPVGGALHAPRRSRAGLYRGDAPAALARPRHAHAACEGSALSGALPPCHERGEPGQALCGASRGSAAGRQPAPRHARARAGARCPPARPLRGRASGRRKSRDADGSRSCRAAPNRC